MDNIDKHEEAISNIFGQFSTTFTDYNSSKDKTQRYVWGGDIGQGVVKWTYSFLGEPNFNYESKGDTKDLEEILPLLNKLNAYLKGEFTSDVKSYLNDLKEMATSSASGAFESPFGGVQRRKVAKMNENKTRFMDLNENDLKNIVKQTLVYHTIYEGNQNQANLKDVEAKIAALQKPNGTLKQGSTFKQKGKNTSDAKSKNNKVSKNQKNNLKNAEVEDVNVDKKATEAHDIEAHANGLQDIEYESISEKTKLRNKKNMDLDKTSKKMAKEAKQRKATKDKSPSTIQMGSDIEVLDKKQKSKKLHVEHSGIKFTSDTHMKRLIPESVKRNGKQFVFTDSTQEFIIEWVGSTENGFAEILEDKTKANIIASINKMKKFL